MAILKSLRSKVIAGSLLAVSMLAFAKVWGPYMISAIGSDYAGTTLAADASAEYEGAQKVAMMYLAPSLNSPGAIAKAIKDDYIRIIYFDGQIADFKIKRWPSTDPVQFDKTVPAKDTPRKPASRQGGRAYCRGGGGGTAYVEYSTGYWGSEAIGPTSGVPADRVVIIGRWIDTGLVSFRADKDDRDACGK